MGSCTRSEQYQHSEFIGAIMATISMYTILLAAIIALIHAEAFEPADAGLKALDAIMNDLEKIEGVHDSEFEKVAEIIAPANDEPAPEPEPTPGPKEDEEEVVEEGESEVKELESNPEEAGQAEKEVEELAKQNPEIAGQVEKEVEELAKENPKQAKEVEKEVEKEASEDLALVEDDEEEEEEEEEVVKEGESEVKELEAHPEEAGQAEKKWKN